MTVYYVGKITDGNNLEFISVTEPIVGQAQKDFLGIELDRAKTLMEIGDKFFDNPELGSFHIRVVKEGNFGLLLVTDENSPIEQEEFTAISNILKSSPTDLETLNKRINFFTRLASLPTNVDRSILLALTPLKEKLQEETDSEKKAAAEKMIDTMQEAVLLRLEDKIDNQALRISVNTVITETALILGKQASWKKLIDDIANVILNFFSVKTSNETTRFSLFSPPNRFNEETELAQEKIQSKFN